MVRTWDSVIKCYNVLVLTTMGTVWWCSEHGTLNQVLQCPGGAWWLEHGTLNQVLQCPGGAWCHGCRTWDSQSSVTMSWWSEHGTLIKCYNVLVWRGGQNMGLSIKCYNVLVGHGD